MRRVLQGCLLVLLVPLAAQGQPVPARDLLEFPLGAILEPPALALEAGSGLWNPATILLDPSSRMRVGVASLAAGSAQGVDGQLLAAAWRRASGTTIAVSLARAAIGGLVRTESDPQSIGTIPYATTMASVTLARSLLPHLSAGVAARWRVGRADQESRQAVAADVGLVLHDLPIRDARVAVSSFLWRPGREIEDRPAVLAAADFRVAGSGIERQTRIGYTLHGVNRGAREQGGFLSGRLDRLELRAAYLATDAGARTVGRLRTGLTLFYARFAVGIGREEGVSGLGPVYQFTLRSLIQ
jgi:hypothetical protein